MTALLNFLLYWSSRVYEFFGSLYTSAKQIALYGYNWILQYSAQAISSAQSYAYSILQSAKSTIWDWIVAKYNDAVGVAHNLYDSTISQLDLWVNWLNGRIQEARDYAAYLVSTVQNVSASLVTSIQDWVAARVQSVQDYAAALVNNVQSFTASQIDSLRSDVIDLQAIVNRLNSAETPILVTFLSNPFGFIMAYVLNGFRDLLCYGLAIGLGTVEKTLPGPPDWNR